MHWSASADLACTCVAVAAVLQRANPSLSVDQIMALVQAQDDTADGDDDGGEEGDEDGYEDEYEDEYEEEISEEEQQPGDGTVQ